jgi:prepilin-type N-terminal cleavage/methylation domain-containing protein
MGGQPIRAPAITPVGAIPASSRGGRRAFTLMECMISLSILAVGMVAILGQFMNIKVARDNAVLDVVAGRIMRNLCERTQAAAWEDMNTITSPWSYARYQDGTGKPAMTEADLENYGIVVDQRGVASDSSWKSLLAVYFEYYRLPASRILGQPQFHLRGGHHRHRRRGFHEAVQSQRIHLQARHRPGPTAQ